MTSYVLLPFLFTDCLICFIERLSLPIYLLIILCFTWAKWGFRNCSHCLVALFVTLKEKVWKNILYNDPSL